MQRQEKEDENSISTITKPYSITNDISNLIYATIRTLINPSLTTSFLLGPIYSNIPHVKSNSFWGFGPITKQNADLFTAAAKNSLYGIATSWSSPFLPTLYITNNTTRHALIQEEHNGIANEESKKLLTWLSAGNNVMATFPVFRDIHSEAYIQQRKFLMRRYHAGANSWLPEIQKNTADFLQFYSEKYGQASLSLRFFVTSLVLYTSSHLLGITQYTLDKLYEKNEYRVAIEDAALYGISERANPEREKIYFELFLTLVEKNFDAITDTENDNLIKNIYNSITQKPFPKVLLILKICHLNFNLNLQ